MTASHDEMLDDVAVYALGTMAADDAARVRAHLETCAECRAEYAALAPSAIALGMSADAATPSPLLKARIMREVRHDAAQADAHPRTARALQGRLWPAYLVAAACFVLAMWSSLVNLSLMQQIKSVRSANVALSDRADGLARTLAQTQTTVADLTSANAEHFAVGGSEIVRVHDHLYLAMHDIPQPPHGKVYQAWTLPKGGKTMQPSLTFVPDAHGSALVALPVDARITTAVAVSVEPAGGSKQPTSKPVLVEQLG
ncbi:MAG: anti-sigma factor [bacterium]|nr:anti-sigma factor [bacterium]